MKKLIVLFITTLSINALACSYETNSKLEMSEKEIQVFKQKVKKKLSKKYGLEVHSFTEDYELSDITPYITKTTLLIAQAAKATNSSMGEAAAECEYYATMDNFEHAKVFNVKLSSDTKSCSQKVSLTKRLKPPFFSKVQTLRRYFQTDCN